MIVCLSCGVRNASGDDFCGSCGAFLEWEGEAVVAPVLPAAQEDPAEPAPAPGIVSRVVTALRGDDDPPAPPQDAPSSPPEEEPAASAPQRPPAPSPPESSRDTAADPSAPQPPPGPPPAVAPRTPALPTQAVVPTRPTTGDRPPAGEQLPQAERRRSRPEQAALAEAIQPGDLVCGSCGVGNAPARHFCRRCGATLADAVPVASPPWWRRLLARRRKAPLAAGDRRAVRGAGAGRRGRRRRRGRVVAAGIVLVLLSLVGLATPWGEEVRGAFGDAADEVRDRVDPRFVPVRPNGASATSARPGRPAGLVIDQVRTTSWSEGVPGPGVGQAVVLRFAGPVDLDRMGLRIGAAAQPGQFTTQSRPSRLRLTYSDGTSQDVELDDSEDFQQREVRARGTSTVRLQVLAVYAGTAGSDTAISEVELFAQE